MNMKLLFVIQRVTKMLHSSHFGKLGKFQTITYVVAHRWLMAYNKMAHLIVEIYLQLFEKSI